ncbi:AraC family transcriptional regulator [Microbacterium sp.]|uniref:helix-turn-helix transcriptional regulator n=1 Tax=Microbacterium sp. TaxID=51671 RepID=UPI002810E8C7|nr:AraC family transcriptional regulator [Microbacterium sp.]
MADVIRVESRDAADVEQIWRKHVPSARLQRIDPERFAFHWLSVGISGMTIIRYTLTAAVYSAVQPEGQLLACRVATPEGWVRCGRSELDVSLPWATDGAQVEAHWDVTADVTALLFDRAHAQELARTITGDELLTLRLTGASPRTPIAGRHWNRSFEYMLNAVGHLEDDPLLEASLMRHALVTTLSSFHSTFLDAAAKDPHTAGASTMRRAVSYIDENAHTAITVDDVARAVHMSTRGLQYAFRRGLDTTPAAYLRRVRLDGAHRDLKNSKSDVTVAEIARRWGFGNTSRFGDLYRQTYGRSPRETLERD